METSHVQVRSILTRTQGFLRTVTSHSLQPYRGCPFGQALCGVGCYVRHNVFVTRGRAWGTFLEVRDNAAAAYGAGYERERAWARRERGGFSIFLSSSTEPFPPQEKRFGVTAAVLEAMIDRPPDTLVIQTHSHGVLDALELLRTLAGLCALRVHLSIETDREGMPGLPPHATPIERRFEAAATLKRAGLPVVITVAPLLPIREPEAFFARIAAVADAVVLDHYIGGDGSSDGSRTLRTALPGAVARVDPGASALAYRDAMGAIAERWLPGRVGYHIAGFAGRSGASGAIQERDSGC